MLCLFLIFELFCLHSKCMHCESSAYGVVLKCAVRLFSDPSYCHLPPLPLFVFSWDATSARAFSHAPQYHLQLTQEPPAMRHNMVFDWQQGKLFYGRRIVCIGGVPGDLP